MSVSDSLMLELPNGDLIEAHRPTDPTVFGLFDIAVGRETAYPRTVYLITGDNTSGIAGRLLPTGEFLPKRSSDVGTVKTIRGILEPDRQMETVWDGACPAEAPEHTHGLFRACGAGAALDFMLAVGRDSLKERPRRDRD